jgi:hypothetical protein
VILFYAAMACFETSSISAVVIGLVINWTSVHIKDARCTEVWYILQSDKLWVNVPCKCSKTLPDALGKWWKKYDKGTRRRQLCQNSMVLGTVLLRYKSQFSFLHDKLNKCWFNILNELGYYIWFIFLFFRLNEIFVI